MKKYFFLVAAISLLIGAGSTYALVEVKQFADVVEGSYYESAVTRMTAMGVIQGKEDGLFHPNDAVSRAEAVTMIDRYNNETLERDNDMATMICLVFDESSSDHPDYPALYEKWCGQAPL